MFFLEFPCFFYYPADVGNLISGSSAFSESNLYIWILWIHILLKPQFSSVQSLSHVQLFRTPWTTARQASLSITSSRSLHKLMSIESVIPSNHLILCHPLLLLPSMFPSIFSNDSVLCIRWPKYWSFSINPSNEHSGLISFRMD